MNDRLLSYLLQVTGASSAKKIATIQSLWSGYGEVARYLVEGSPTQSVVLKHVTLPDHSNSHPRGWNTNRSHTRKVKSFAVECEWYEHYSNQCDDTHRIPKCFGTVSTDKEYLMVLEDLDASGYMLRIKDPSIEDMNASLKWLANFHSHFLFDTSKTSTKKFEGLWDVGCYWHLDTRPDELEALTDIELKQSANKIDQLLKSCRYQTLVHGDAKLANFCFSTNRDQVAAVDFQYVGKGCGIRDVAYFIGSCLDSDRCHKHGGQLLDRYFDYLQVALEKNSCDISFDKLEEEWRRMYGVAWADFQRFLKGWCSDHWKIHDFSESITKTVLKNI